MDERAITLDYTDKFNGRFRNLHERFKKDQRIYHLERFVMKNSKQQAIPNVQNVTLNDPRTFADLGIHIMGSARQIFNVSNAQPSSQNEVIEKTYNYIYDHNDEILQGQMIEPLDFCENWYSFIRGPIITRTLVYQDSDNPDWMQVEIMPMDPLYTTWGPATRRGHSWFRTEARMSKEQVWEAYDYEPVGASHDDEMFPVHEIWTPNYFSIYVNRKLVMDPIEHRIGYTPFELVYSPTEPNIFGSGELHHQSESAYAANRDLYEQANDLASTWATLNKMQFMSPIAFISERGRKVKMRPYGIGVVVNLRKGEQFVEIPTKELSASGQNLFGQYMGRIQRGGLPFTEYGELSFELSAVAIAQLSDKRDQTFVPRLTAKRRLRERQCKSIKHQITRGGYITHLSESDLILDDIEQIKEALSQKFMIHVEFQSISSEQNITNLQLSQIWQANGYSKKTALRDIIKYPDVEGEMKQIALETSYHLCPELQMLDYALDLAPVKDMSDDERNSIRAETILWKLGQITEQSLHLPQLQQAAQGSPDALNTPYLLKMARMPEHLATENQGRTKAQSQRRGRQAREVSQAQEG